MIEKLKTLGLRIGAVLAVLFVIVNAARWHINWIYDKTSQNVVKLRIGETEHDGGGTGFQVISESGNRYILTNRHICVAAREHDVLKVELEEGRFLNVRVLEVSSKTDLCLLTPVANMSGLKLAASLKAREDIAVVGHPLLQAQTPARGIVTNFQNIEIQAEAKDSEECSRRYNGDFRDVPIFFGMSEKLCMCKVDSFRTTAVIYPGNSGSPVVNLYGNLVGVMFAGDNRMNLGYAVPLNDVKEFLKYY